MWKISSQICASNLQEVFTLGDGCWLPIKICRLPTIDGWNRAIAIAELLVRSTSVRWWSYLLPNTEASPHTPCGRCAATGIARLEFIPLTVVPHGIAEWLARVDRVRWTLAIGDWRFCPSKIPTKYPALNCLQKDKKIHWWASAGRAGSKKGKQEEKSENVHQSKPKAVLVHSTKTTQTSKISVFEWHSPKRCPQLREIGF